MDSIKLKRGGAAAPITPHTLRWEVGKDGRFKEFSPEQKAVRALRLAFKLHVEKTVQAIGAGAATQETNKQYYLEGHGVWIRSCDTQSAGGNATYHAVGRAEIGQIHVPSDSFSTEMIAFDLTFKDKKNEWGSSDVELINASIDVLPKGSPLVPPAA